jgi:hypothetical protein
MTDFPWTFTVITHECLSTGTWNSLRITAHMHTIKSVYLFNVWITDNVSARKTRQVYDILCAWSRLAEITGRKLTADAQKRKQMSLHLPWTLFYLFSVHELYIILFPNKRRYAETALCFVIHQILPHSQFFIRTNFNLRSSTGAKKAENITSACTSEQQPSHFYRHIDTPHYPFSPHSCDKLLALFRLLNVSCSRAEYTPPSWEPKSCHFSLREWLGMPSPRMRSPVQ